jgi:hypothetical protein
MKITKFCILIIIFTYSCSPQKSNNGEINRSVFTDTIPISEQGDFFSCCKASNNGIEFDLFKPFVVLSELSTNGGTSFRKDYFRIDSVFISIRYDSYPIYDSSRMHSYIEGYVKGMSKTDTMIKTDRFRLLKIWRVVGQRVVINYVKFDRTGYVSLNIEDNRNITQKQKNDFVEEFYSSMKTVKFPLPNDKVVGHISDTIKLIEGDWHLKNLAILSPESKFGERHEVFILADVYEFSDCSKLKFEANNLIRDIFNQKKVKFISFVREAENDVKFTRFAQFRAYHYKIKKETFDEINNFADCVWIDSALAKRLFDPDECERWNNAINRAIE